MSHLHNTRGFSAFEFVIVVLIIAGLLWFVLDRLLRVQVIAERALLEQNIGLMKSALALTISEHVARDNIAGLRTLIGSNPMDLMSETPPTYLGSLATAPAKPPAGSWFFDRSRHQLIYQITNVSHIDISGPEKSQIGFKISPVYDDINGNGRFDTGDTLKGLKLQPQTTYRWSMESLAPD